MQLTMITPKQLDFILIRQKDTIISLIEARCYHEAETTLIAVEELWRACNYFYKITELRARIQSEQEATYR